MRVVRAGGEEGEAARRECDTHAKLRHLQVRSEGGLWLGRSGWLVVVVFYSFLFERPPTPSSVICMKLRLWVGFLVGLRMVGAFWLACGVGSNPTKKFAISGGGRVAGGFSWWFVVVCALWSERHSHHLRREGGGKIFLVCHLQRVRVVGGISCLRRGTPKPNSTISKEGGREVGEK